MVAGAGTGKTRVITEKINHLISEDGTDPMKILALTFTEKASEEMLNRVQDTMPLAYEEPWVYTFHRFCERVLRKEALEIGLDPSYKIIPFPEQWLLFKENLFSMGLDYYRPLGNPTKFVAAMLKFISRLQDENISPEDLQIYTEAKNFEDDEAKKWAEITNAYKTYQEVKVDESKLDFGDLITWTIKLFIERPSILEKYRKQFEHILVDEFQDTNYAQYELIKLLFPQKDTYERGLTVVGDDSQSIYKFRGAAISNILQFKKDYPSTETVTLIKNYRSGQSVLDAAYRLIKNNDPDTLETKLGISKKLISQKTGNNNDQKPKIIEVDTLENEVDFVITKIINILGEETQYTYKDFAILARANNHLDPFVLALRKYELPYQLVGNRGLYDRNEIRDILALLKVLVEPYDPTSIYRVLNLDCMKINSDIINKIMASSRYEKKEIWDVMEETENEQVKRTLQLLEKYRSKIPKTTPVGLVYELINEIDYLEKFVREENLENQLSLKNLDLFLEKIKRFEIDFNQSKKELPTLIEFMNYTEAMLEAGENPAQAEIEDIDTINLLTVHSSKGLEFPVVFMVNLVSTRFPSMNRSDKIEVPDDLIKETLPVGNAHIQEERRLFYVGMTRSQKYLHMVYGKDYGGKRQNRPSGFLEETGIDPLIVEMEKDVNRQKSFLRESSKLKESPDKEVNYRIPESVSYTQISTYEGCPLKYKYRYILNIPTPPSHALSFGNTVHKTLREFHERLLAGEVPLDKLLQLYEKNWEPLGYDSKEHREERFGSGKELLRNYYNSLDEKTETIGIEKAFNIKIDEIRLYGWIDRIDRTKGGIEIVDYKTGSLKDQKEVDKDKQITLYAIGAKEALKLNPDKLTLHFLEHGKKISTTRTDESMEKAKKEAAEVVSKIKDRLFDAIPGYHCRWCDYNNICPHAVKE